MNEKRNKNKMLLANEIVQSNKNTDYMANCRLKKNSKIFAMHFHSFKNEIYIREKL